MLNGALTWHISINTCEQQAIWSSSLRELASFFGGPECYSKERWQKNDAVLSSVSEGPFTIILMVQFIRAHRTYTASLFCMCVWCELEQLPACRNWHFHLTFSWVWIIRNPVFSFLRFPLPNNNQRAPTKFGENLFAHNKGIVRQTFISERGKISSRNITVLPAAPQMLMGSVGTEVNGHKLCREKNKQRDACHPSCGGIA